LNRLKHRHGIGRRANCLRQRSAGPRTATESLNGEWIESAIRFGKKIYADILSKFSPIVAARTDAHVPFIRTAAHYGASIQGEAGVAAEMENYLSGHLELPLIS
jgi:hypothetical protein